MLIPVGETELIFDMNRPLSDFHNKTIIALYWSKPSAKHHPAAYQIQKEVLEKDAEQKVARIIGVIDSINQLFSNDSDNE
ncbi:MAG: hypothetical protein ACOVQN_12130 [Exiguobacterium sp.]